MYKEIMANKKECVKVVVRVRPLSSKEKQGGYTIISFSLDIEI